MYVQVWCPVQRSVRSKTKLISKWRRLLTKQEQELWMRARIVCEDSAGLHLHPPHLFAPTTALAGTLFPDSRAQAFVDSWYSRNDFLGLQRTVNKRLQESLLLVLRERHDFEVRVQGKEGSCGKPRSQTSVEQWHHCRQVPRGGVIVQQIRKLPG